MALTYGSQPLGNGVECFIPTDPDPSGIGIPLGPSPLQGIVEPLWMVDEVRSGPTFETDDTAVGMIVIRLKQGHPPLFNRRNGSAVGRAQRTVTADRAV